MTSPSAAWTHVPDRPRVTVVLQPDGSGTVNGRQIRIPPDSDARTVLMTEACRFAATLGRPVRVEAHDPDGVWDLVAHPDGSVTASDAGGSTPEAPRKGRRPVLQRRDREPDEPTSAPPAPPAPMTSAPMTGSAPSEVTVRHPTRPAPTRSGPAGQAPAGQAPAASSDTARDAAEPRTPAAASGPGGFGTVVTERAPGAVRPTAPAPPDARAPSTATASPPPTADTASAPTVRTTPPPNIGWYQGTAAPARPAQRAAPRSRAGLVTPEARRVPGRPEPVVWSGRSPDRRPLSTTALLGGLVAGGLTVAVLIFLAVPRSGDDHAASPTPSRPSVAATSPTLPALQVAVPPGYRNTPVWRTDVAAWTRSIATDDGTVLTRDPSGHLLQLDPATGRVLWSSAETNGEAAKGPWPARVDGAPAAVLVAPGHLAYWLLPPLPSASGTGSAPASVPASGSAAASGSPTTSTGVTVLLPVGASVSWGGPSPLVNLPNKTVAVVRSGTLVPVPLPAGSRALAADDTGVLAATSKTWVLQPAGKPPVSPRPIARPTKAGAAPLRVEAVGTSLLLTIWPEATGSGQVVALMDTARGVNVVQTEVTAVADLRKFGIVRESGGTQLALGPVVIDTYAAKVDLLDMRYTVKALSRGHAWTLFKEPKGTTEQAFDLRLTATGDFPTVPFGAGQAVLPVGVSQLGGGDSRAMVVTPEGSGWIMCGLATG